jgi:hypothetical protein
MYGILSRSKAFLREVLNPFLDTDRIHCIEKKNSSLCLKASCYQLRPELQEPDLAQRGDVPEAGTGR